MAVQDNSKATLASLEQQVRAIDRAQEGTERALRELGNKFEAGLQGLANKVDQRSTTQWPTIFGTFGAGFAILTTMGWMAYMPIQRDTTRLDTNVNAILERGVFQRAYDSDQSRVTEILKGLRGDLNATIQQQRYNADQERLTHTLDDLRTRFAVRSEVDALFKERQIQIETNKSNIELLRVRSYADVDRLSKVEQSAKDTDSRVDAISRRLAEFIRDMGKH